MDKNEASLNCRCGACTMVLCNPTMLYRLECLCFDCRQRGLISASKRAGNDIPAEIAAYERGIDDYYFANGFLVDQKSRDLLTFTKLREDAFNTTAMSSCCGTLMCGTHPAYEGASVSVNADSCRVIVDEIIPVQVILFGCDFPPARFTAVQKRAQAPIAFSVYDEMDSAPMRQMLEAVKMPLADQYKHDGYVTFEQLCDEKTIEIDNSFYAESRRQGQ